MAPDGLEVTLDEFAAQVIKSMAKREIIDMIAQKFFDEQGKDFVGQIQIDAEELKDKIHLEAREVKERVMDSLVEEIIDDWRRR